MGIHKIVTFGILLLVSIALCGCCCCTNGSTTYNNGATYPSSSVGKTTPTPTPIGFSKTNPAPVGTSVQFKEGSIPDSKIRITLEEVHEGAEAYSLIEKNDGLDYVKPAKPDDGDEYLIAKFRIEFIDYAVGDTPKDFYASYMDFKCYTPDNLRVYNNMFYPIMEPKLLKQLFKGDSTEGWITFTVKPGYDHYLIGFNSDKIWFTTE